jgi:flagellar motor switch protein FliN/FliY
VLDPPLPDQALELSDAAVAELQAQLTPVPTDAPSGAADLEAVGDVEVEVVVELGRAAMTIADILRLNTGSVVGVGTEVGAQLLVRVNGRPVWSGEPVADDDQLAVRIVGLAGEGDRPEAPG